MIDMSSECIREELLLENDLLMTPGPTEIPSRVLKAMVEPSMVPYHPEFTAILDETLTKLGKVYQTENEVVVMPGSGRIGLESALTSVIEDGDRVLNIVAGFFGRWIKEMASGLGGRVEEFNVEWGKPIDLNKLEEALKGGKYRLITLVHNETSAGSTYPAGEIARLAHRYGALVLIDTISSLGGVDVPTDDWEIDLNVSTTHKCLSAPIGLALVSVSPRAWEKMESRKDASKSYFLNLLKWKSELVPVEGQEGKTVVQRHQAVFMPVHSILALREAVDIILEEGLESRFERHLLNAGALREGIRAMGLEIFAEESVASPTVTCVLLPEGINAQEVVAVLRDKHHIRVGGGLVDLKERAIRLGHMGLTASPHYIIPALNAIESTLFSMGYEITKGDAVRRAQEALLV